MTTKIVNGYPYKLALTSDERKALDWIGDRYFHGSDLIALLHDEDANWSYAFAGGDWLPDNGETVCDVDWDSPMPITIDMAEHVAWQIKDGIEAEAYTLTCLGSDLKNKLLTFCDRII